jgi:hypothetical protein
LPSPDISGNDFLLLLFFIIYSPFYSCIRGHKRKV